MHPHYKHLNLPTWIIGSSLGKGALIDRAAEVLKVWPTLDQSNGWRPTQFNPVLERHCR
jgi:hypothetical protein